jgi:hypothetical protein
MIGMSAPFDALTDRKLENTYNCRKKNASSSFLDRGVL